MIQPLTLEVEYRSNQFGAAGIICSFDYTGNLANRFGFTRIRVPGRYKGCSRKDAKAQSEGMGLFGFWIYRFGFTGTAFFPYLAEGILYDHWFKK